MSTPWVIGPNPDYSITYGNESDQVIEFFGANGPLIALIHGGYWRAKHNREHMRALASKLAGDGFRVANLEYRREAGAPKKTTEDIKSALTKLPKLTAIVGFSVGGQLALLNANLAPKLILLAPVTDLVRTKSENLGEGAVNEFFVDHDLDEFDPMTKRYNAKLLIIHGDKDQRVPIAHSRAFAKAQGAELVEISGADHFDVIDPNGKTVEIIKGFLA